MPKGNSGRRNKNKIVQLYPKDNFSKYEHDIMFGRYSQEEKNLAYEIFNAPVGTKLISWNSNYPNEKTISEIKNEHGEKYLVHVSGHDRGKEINSNINLWLSNPNWENYSHSIPNYIHQHIWGDHAQILYPEKKKVKK